MEKERKKILVVGAGGFAGGFIVEEGLRRGYDVWAGVRESTSRKYLTDPRIHFIVFDFDADDPRRALAERLRADAPEGGWDWIIYNLGATKCLRFSDFSRINCDYLQWMLDALKQSDLIPEKFLFVSSLSAMGAGRKGELRTLHGEDGAAAKHPLRDIEAQGRDDSADVRGALYRLPRDGPLRSARP